MSTELPPRVVLVAASQCPINWFERATLLGRSLQQFPEPLRPEVLLLLENRGAQAKGLSEWYNEAMDTIEGDAIVAFVHDDIYIHDWNLRFSLSQALCFWDVVGVAGSNNVPYGQPSWTHELDAEGNLVLSSRVTRSGCVNEFDPTHPNPYYYGPSPMACDLLDGIFLAADLKRLRSKHVRFDPQYRFHCYDSAFCYQARAAGLSVGTWPIPLTHASWGSFDQEWLAAARQLQDQLMATRPGAQR